MAPDVEPDTLLGGTYRIVRRIGSGGMGEVYEATHERLAHRYAVKFLHPSMRDHPEALPRFMREAQVTSRLRHPGIVSVVDFNTLPSGVAYLVMEYLEGESLATLLARTGPLPLPRVVDIADQLCSALTAAHAQGIVHRDIHPQNVFVVPGTVGQTERMKILDFGISKIASVSQKITGMATVMGTPQYMSPEQAEGKTDELDAASDQFSLAAIVYELLTGRPAFSGDTLASVAYQVVHGRPAPIQSYRPELPVEIDKVIGRAMAKDKKDRFPSVAELAVHLRWTATLPGNDIVPEAGAAHGTQARVSTDAEETTAVSELPSGMAAVLRDSGGRKPVEADSTASPEGALPDEGTRSRRGRRSVIGAVVVGSALLIAVVMGLASRARKPEPDPAARGSSIAVSDAAGAPTGGAPSGAAPPANPPSPVAPSGPTDGEAAIATGTPGPGEPPTPEPTEPRRSPGRTRPHVAAAGKGEAAAAAAGTNAGPVAKACRITVGSYPWSDLWIDGVDTSQHTPVVGLPIACGSHRLEFKRRDLRIDQIENVTLNEGHEFKRQYELQGAGLDD